MLTNVPVRRGRSCSRRRNCPVLGRDHPSSLKGGGNDPASRDRALDTEGAAPPHVGLAGRFRAAFRPRRGTPAPRARWSRESLIATAERGRVARLDDRIQDGPLSAQVEGLRGGTLVGPPLAPFFWRGHGDRRLSRCAEGHRRVGGVEGSRAPYDWGGHRSRRPGPVAGGFIISGAMAGVISFLVARGPSRPIAQGTVRNSAPATPRARPRCAGSMGGPTRSGSVWPAGSS